MKWTYYARKQLHTPQNGRDDLKHLATFKPFFLQGAWQSESCVHSEPGSSMATAHSWAVDAEGEGG
jgi:hypothetical protein